MKEVEAKTIIEDLASKKQTILEKTSSTLADYVRTRISEGKAAGLHRDVLKLIQPFTAEERTLILAMTLEYTGKNSGKSSGSSRSDAASGSFTGASKGSKKSNSGFGSWAY